jgi:hypothetical protein
MKMIQKNRQENMQENSVVFGGEKVHLVSIKASAPLYVCVIRELFFCPETVAVFSGALS